MITDFEKAAINAFSGVFPNCEHHGCFFHLCQCVFRQIIVCGLKTQYEKDADFALAMRCLPALAFVPESDVVNAFKKLSKSNIIPFVADAVVNYFEETWIGKKYDVDAYDHLQNFPFRCGPATKASSPIHPVLTMAWRDGIVLLSQCVVVLTIIFGKQ